VQVEASARALQSGFVDGVEHGGHPVVLAVAACVVVAGEEHQALAGCG